MTHRVTPLLVFDGRAEEAMALYVLLFADAGIDRVERWGPGEPGREGTVKHATFHLGERPLQCIDSSVAQPFTFTPAISLVVECGEAAEVDRLFGGLSDGGAVLMPLDAYPFSPRFGWVTDRFGVSWQLSLSQNE